MELLEGDAYVNENIPCVTTASVVVAMYLGTPQK